MTHRIPDPTLRRRSLLTTALAAAVAAPLAGAAPAEARPVVAQVMARNLRVPWGLAFLPTGDALVGERMSGRVHRVGRGGRRVLVGTVAGVADHRVLPRRLPLTGPVSHGMR